MPQVDTRQIGPLNCIVVDGADSDDKSHAEILVVLCHGYGASLRDLAPLAGEWLSMLGDNGSKFRFVFPDAPHSLAELGMPDAKAWWPINMARLTELIQASQFDELHDQTPPGIDEARQALQETIAAAVRELDCPSPKLVLGGFSQGAMLTMDTALRGDIPTPQWLLLFSGTLVCQPAWKATIPTRLAKSKVFQAHGTVDPILPFSSAEALRDLMKSEGADVQFHSFVGPHTIDGISIEKVATILASLAAN
ncbi:putative hydrolase [Rubripirellula amarantea]|uniref:Putative hydrolase n=1 Tax=Rubripirellula amarantea TaxID=2527999 RepID=A0A5C5WTZ7_9BACT|nr:alpha/beta fold hydrolase [Rubripirellula amarantea]TWT54000.1 putative hydrolase [Rubripirellula amarantea]